MKAITIFIIALLCVKSQVYSQADTCFVFLDTNNAKVLYWKYGIIMPYYENNILESPAYEIPKNSGKSTIYTSSLWAGGLDNENVLHFAGRTYDRKNREFNCGPMMDSIYYVSEQSNWSKIWKINRNDILYHVAHWNEPGYLMPQSVAYWPGNGDTSKGQPFYLAPYKDNNGNLIYDPENGDFPMIYGDQEVFFIINDDKNTQGTLWSNKLGIEIHGMAYAFNISGNDAFNNTTFLKYKIFNRSNLNYHDVFVGSFTDIDIGYAFDDYIGCDVQRSSYFGYNGCLIDGSCSYQYSGEYNTPQFYGANPPAQSVTFLGSKMPPDGIDNPANVDYGINGYGFSDNIVDNERYGMCYFTYFDNGNCSNMCDPREASQFYEYLKGNWQDGLPKRYGNTGYNTDTTRLLCRFMFPGNSDPLHWGTNYIIPEENPDSWYDGQSGFLTSITIHNSPDTFIVGSDTIIHFIDTFYFCFHEPIITSDTVFTINYTRYGPPYDRRGIASVGPINFNSGEMIEFDIAYVWGQDIAKATGSYNQLLSNIDTVRKYFVLGKTPTGQSFETYAGSPVQNNFHFNIYPNPAHDYILIESNFPEKNFYTIYDTFGRKVKEGLLTNNSLSVVDVSNLGKGIYFLVFTNKQFFSKKIVIE